MEEFNLSEKIGFWATPMGRSGEGLAVLDVKEFIRLLKEEIIKLNYPGKVETQMLYEIDKLCGDKLK
jgi:hypothetical protein